MNSSRPLAFLALLLTLGLACGHQLGDHCQNVDACAPGLTCDITEMCNDTKEPAGCYGICRESCGNSGQCGGTCPSQTTCVESFPLNCVCR